MSRQVQELLRVFDDEGDVQVARRTRTPDRGMMDFTAIRRKHEVQRFSEIRWIKDVGVGGYGKV